MHGTRVENEIQTCPGKAREEFSRQQIALESIAAPAGENDVARHVCAAVREGMHVVQGGEIEIQRRGAVHTPAAAVAHGRAFDRSLLMSGGDWLRPATEARGSREGDTMKVPAWGQCHLAKMGHPANGKIPVAGCRAWWR
jgi:hypothetical protein